MWIGGANLNTVVLIPAYQPDEKLIYLVDELLEKNVPYIVIVDDGSSNNCKEIFKTLLAKKRCQVISHTTNLGKGSALKTGIKAIIDSQIPYLGIVTADADGQHLVNDIIKTIEVFERHTNALILGCRDFSKEVIPLKSKLGNVITRFLFKLVTKVSVSDTQTGLRAFSLKRAKQFLSIDGSRYEYEMNMLFEAIEVGVSINEVKIETVYLDGNKASHFNPLIDSFHVYKGFVKFGFTAILSFLIDISLYAVFSGIFRIYGIANFILFATVFARALSSAFNFVCNKKFVFNNRDKSIKTLPKYYMLCVIQMLISAFAVKLFYEIGIGNTVFIKIVVDSILFFISYFIQKRVVFKRSDCT